MDPLELPKPHPSILKALALAALIVLIVALGVRFFVSFGMWALIAWLDPLGHG